MAESEAYLGDIALREQENDQARALSKQALRLFPDIRIAHYDLGVLASEEGNCAEAAAELKEAIRLDPKRPTRTSGSRRCTVNRERQSWQQPR